jgi:DNA-binding LacI/PurR family transcriptional regulator
MDSQPVGYAPTIVIDQRRIGRAAVSRLVDTGKRRILALMPSDPRLAELAGLRLEGAQLEAATSQAAAVTAAECPYEMEAVGAVLRNAFERRWPPNGLFAYNDEYAILALRALRDQHIDVPGDISVIGCDDIDMAQVVTPALTTVRLAGHQIGATAARMLHRSIAGESVEDWYTTEEHVVVIRESA